MTGVPTVAELLAALAPVQSLVVGAFVVLAAFDMVLQALKNR